MNTEERLKEYENRFGEPLPLMCFMGCPDEILIQIIDDCLRRGLDVWQAGYCNTETLY